MHLLLGVSVWDEAADQGLVEICGRQMSLGRTATLCWRLLNVLTQSLLFNSTQALHHLVCPCDLGGRGVKSVLQSSILICNTAYKLRCSVGALLVVVGGDATVNLWL